MRAGGAALSGRTASYMLVQLPKLMHTSGKVSQLDARMQVL